MPGFRVEDIKEYQSLVTPEGVKTSKEMWLEKKAKRERMERSLDFFSEDESYLSSRYDVP